MTLSGSISGAMGKESQGDRESAMKAYNKAYSIIPALPKLKDRLGLVASATSAKPGLQRLLARRLERPPRQALLPPVLLLGLLPLRLLRLCPAVSAKELELMASAQGKMRSGDLDGALKESKRNDR